jgi:hypothetical protein
MNAPTKDVYHEAIVSMPLRDPRLCATVADAQTGTGNTISGLFGHLAINLLVHNGFVLRPSHDRP